MVDEHAGAMRTTLGSLEAAYYALPDTLRQVGTKLTEPDGMSQLAVIAELLAALLVAGFFIEWLYRRALRRFRTRLEQTPATTFSGAGVPARDGIVARSRRDPGVGASPRSRRFFLLWHDHALRRTAIFDFMLGVIIVRTAMVVARFLLAPREPSKRLLPFADGPARDAVPVCRRRRHRLRDRARAGHAAAGRRRKPGDARPHGDRLRWSSGIAVSIWTVWRVRAPIADLIRGQDGRGTIRRLARRVVADPRDRLFPRRPVRPRVRHPRRRNGAVRARASSAC